MNPIRRRIVAGITLTPFGTLVPIRTLAQPVAGRDYSVLSPEQPVENAAKVEVLEFFWYGCIHCYNLEALLEAWVPRLPADVQFRRIPAVFDSPRWAHDAALYFAFEALGVLERLHRPVFDAIHKSRLRTDNPQALAEWLQKNGVDPKRFDDTMKSFGVQSKVRRATHLTRAFRVDGTPLLAVHGRYTVSAEQGRTHEGMLATAEQLIGIARKSAAVRK
jgi:thiol:disulfide interchange protein DsbA